MRKAAPNLDFSNGADITAPSRQIKSSAEIALMQWAKDITMVVHKAAARILHPDISTEEVTHFINEAHKRVGASGVFVSCYSDWQLLSLTVLKTLKFCKATIGY